ncbi:MAG: hypothetical protein Q3W96_02680, partial [Dysosmobacter sp.]|uniref:hypothetical protein n=1 Tax=Dysosmobacter sp. TaxID=2591382 RepID=UPI002847891A
SEPCAAQKRVFHLARKITMWAVEAKTLPGLCLCFKPTGTRECFDHIFSHSAVWSTRKQCFQRVAESKRNGAETARNEWKSCEKSFLTSLLTAAMDWKVLNVSGDFLLERAIIMYGFALMIRGTVHPLLAACTGAAHS